MAIDLGRGDYDSAEHWEEEDRGAMWRCRFVHANQFGGRLFHFQACCTLKTERWMRQRRLPGREGQEFDNGD